MGAKQGPLIKEATCIACLATLGSSIEGSWEAEGSHHLTYGRLFRGLERSLEAKEKSQGSRLFGLLGAQRSGIGAHRSCIGAQRCCMAAQRC